MDISVRTVIEVLEWMNVQLFSIHTQKDFLTWLLIQLTERGEVMSPSSKTLRQVLQWFCSQRFYSTFDPLISTEVLEWFDIQLSEGGEEMAPSTLTLVKFLKRVEFVEMIPSSDMVIYFLKQITEIPSTQTLTEALDWLQPFGCRFTDEEFEEEIVFCPSTDPVSSVLSGINRHKSEPGLIYDSNGRPWCWKQIFAIVSYATKVGYKDEQHEREKWECKIPGLCLNHVHFRKLFYMVMKYYEVVQNFFRVPDQQLVSDHKSGYIPKMNEVVASFIDFLIQMLDFKTYMNVPLEDLINTLRKELIFVVVVLGDSPLQRTELEEVKNLMLEFEEVANDAGNLVYSFFISDDRFKPRCAEHWSEPVKKYSFFVTRNRAKRQRLEISIRLLLNKIEQLKDKIRKFLHHLPPMFLEIVAQDSLFVMDSLIDDLDHWLNHNVDLVSDVKDQMRLLSEELLLSQSVIVDLEMQQVPINEEARKTISQARGMAHEAEYLISFHVAGEVPVWYLMSRLPGVIYSIKLIRIRLKEIKKNVDDMGNPKVATGFSVEVLTQYEKWLPPNKIVVGFEQDAIEILDQLVGQPRKLEKVCIYGMPGLGKTTLGRKLYDDSLVVYHFDVRVWCVVSQTYQKRNLLISILTSLTGELHHGTILNMEDECIAERIYKSLKGMRYMIVLDDVWNSTVWDDLRRYFPDDGNGSRILFTSRIKNAAPPETSFHALPFLNNEQCWDLLQHKVFHKEICPVELVEIGKQIASLCGGLPIAVVVIAGFLATTERGESAWKKVKDCLEMETFLLSDANNCLQMLELSYKHLPNSLKSCFLYFGIYPEDTVVPVEELIFLWIAEGFIPKEEKKNLEIVAEEHLMELISRSLVLVAKTSSLGKVKACFVHDLMLDFCLKKAREENFLKLIDDQFSMYEQEHRVGVHSPSLSSISRPFSQHIRSFLGHLCFPSYCFPNMRFLRVLDLSSINNHLLEHELEGIVQLVHLRFLALNDVSSLPASIGSLVKLEFLLVRNTRIFYITPELLKLVKLRNLDLGEAQFSNGCSITTPQATNLQSLSLICICELVDAEILRSFPHLRKLKCRYGSSLVDEKGKYRYPDLRFLRQLESLKIICSDGVQSEFMNLNFPSTIRKLTLSGLELPWEKMSMIGSLPRLSVLKLEHNSFIGEIWETNDGEFLELRHLELKWLNDLVQWNASSEHFPMLQRLVFRSCGKLLNVPSEIGDIATLRLIKVKGCNDSVMRSALEIQQGQWEMGNQDLKIIISDNDFYHAWDSPEDVARTIETLSLED